MKRIKIAFTTLGCKVNQDETLGMERLFLAAGYQLGEFSELADIYIVNTCTVTHLASRKSRQMLRQAKRRNPTALVVAVGCYPQVAAKELAELPEVDLIVGNSHKPDLVKIVEQTRAGSKQIEVGTDSGFMDLPLSLSSHRHRATLKIQDGCQRYCTYCIIPKARGRLRSMCPSEVLKRGQEIAANGFKEIVLTGINLTSYGKNGDSYSLANVVDALAKVVSPVRIRISSVEPTDFGEDLIAAIVANANICKDFHIPLQSGSDTVLQRMGRKYTACDYLNLVTRLNERFDRPSFSTDIMVGFPAETESEFKETMALASQVGFCRLHVFRYSRRKGTPAASYPDQVPPAIAARRSRELIALGHKLAESFAGSLRGLTEEVLIEEHSPRPGEWVGYGQRYMRIHCRTSACPGIIVPVVITEPAGNELLSEPLV